jgi:hypothetical protein
MPKYDKTEMDAIRTIVRNKIKMVVEAKEKERVERYHKIQAEFSAYTRKICDEVKAQLQVRIDACNNFLRSQFPGVTPKIDIHIYSPTVSVNGKGSIQVSINGTITLCTTVEISAEQGERWEKFTEEVNAASSPFRVSYEEMEIMLAEIILTDRKNISNKIDEIVKAVIAKAS